ncbi:hypothetical protein GALL_328930 [mine drainage metagenome]|uniref:Uncharacterized protein n=1 Tax=mine drainage metagenome TaxID=410659 RepID=A0A1J5QNV0_9ZZZZ
MASIREINGKLFWDFRYKGIRCREYTSLEDTRANRQKMEKVLKKIEEDIASGTFSYRRQFPQSKFADKFESRPAGVTYQPQVATQGFQSMPMQSTPLFSVFANQWFNELSIGWRRTYKTTVRQILDKRLIPEFGNKECVFHANWTPIPRQTGQSERSDAGVLVLL